MKSFSIEVHDNKVGFFLELMKSLNFVRIKEKTNVFELTHEQKEELEKRFVEYNNNPNDCLNWDNVCNDIEKRL